MKRLFLTAALALGLAAPAVAASIDFRKPILDLAGHPVTPTDADKTPITLGKVATDALIANVQGERVPADEKARRFFLAMKIQKGEVDLTAEEIALVKKVIGEIYGPLVVGRSLELLDPASVPAKR